MKKTYRIEVETLDGFKTIWYETTAAKNATERLCKRVNAQLAGLALKRIEVKVSV